MNRFARLSLALTLATAMLVGCPRPPTPEPSPGNTDVRDGWVDTARTVLTTIAWAAPLARSISEALVPEGVARAALARSFEALGDAARSWQASLDVYVHEGGETCAVRAGALATCDALMRLADVLADSGIGLGNTLGGLLDGAAMVVDNLAQRCVTDGGLRASASMGDTVNAHLRLVFYTATQRSIALRDSLDNLRRPQ